MTSSGPRKSKTQRLAELGISEERFEQYRQMFCSTRLRQKYIKLGHDGWLTCHFPWDDRLILTHLAHEEMIGLFPSANIDYVMVDIDHHDPSRNPTVEDRASRVLRVFDCDPLVYRSSDSGGLRVCYFLQGVYGKKSVYEFAHGKLADAGIRIKPGLIEIMATDKGDRLAFGEGSFLVDPHTFEPLYQIHLSGMIDHAWNLYSGTKLLIEEHLVRPSKPPQTERTFSEIVADLLESGLPPDMTTNAALMKLGWDLICRRRFSREEAARYLKSWIRSKHNGNSRRFNSGKIDDLDSHIERVVRSCDREKSKFKSHKPKKPIKRLTIGDVERITTVFSDYRAQLAAFSLLEHIKTSGVLRDCIDCSDTKGMREDNRGNYSVLGFLQSWECEIPYGRFIQLDGFDKTHPVKTRKLLKDNGLIKLHKEEDRSRHKCKAYLVFFTFDEKSDEVISLDEALLRIRSESDLKRDYGRYRSARIIGG